MTRPVARERTGSERRRTRGENPAPAPPSPDVLGLQRSAGNQAVVELLRRRGARSQIARWIVCMTTPGESTEQKKKLNAGLFLLQKKTARGSTTVVEQDAAPLKALAGVGLDEDVYIVAHSDGKLIWGQSPAQLAKLLFDNLPDGYHGRIKLTACHSAEPRAAAAAYQALGANTTYAQELAAELFKLQEAGSGRGVAVPSVHGRPGALATLDPLT